MRTSFARNGARIVGRSDTGRHHRADTARTRSFPPMYDERREGPALGKRGLRRPPRGLVAQPPVLELCAGCVPSVTVTCSDWEPRLTVRSTLSPGGCVATDATRSLASCTAVEPSFVT